MTTGNDDTLRPLGPDDPRHISGYELVARIGEGGMGTVYLSHTRGGQAVALKLIRREYGTDADFRRRFEQEVQAARRVQGYHLVPVVDHDTSGELPWLASVFITGVPLHDALQAYGPLPLEAVFQLIGCSARALSSIHAAGVVHRDLKPSNVLLAADGPYIIDFGIARATDATQLTRSGGVIGTPQFMSPEHALGEPVGPASDVFSLGLIAALAATGRHPYGDGGAITIAAQIANSASRPPSLDAYDDRLRPLLDGMLAADPDRRIGTDELAARCAEAAGRPLNDFGDWLPAPVAAEIARRTHAVLAPPPPLSQPGPPTAPPTAPPSYGQAGTAPQTPGYPQQQPTGMYGAGAPYPGTPGGPAGKRKGRGGRIALAAAALVLAVGAGAGAAVYLIGGDDDGDKDGRESSAEQAPGDGKASKGADESTPDAGATSSPDREPTYTPVFEKKAFTLRTASSTGSNVPIDLDEPKAYPQGSPDNGGMDPEIDSNNTLDASIDFKTAAGAAGGDTPEECASAVDTNALPEKIPYQELAKDEPIGKGTRLCTVTSEGNLAMLEITEVHPQKTSELPYYSTELTLWKVD